MFKKSTQAPEEAAPREPASKAETTAENQAQVAPELRTKEAKVSRTKDEQAPESATARDQAQSVESQAQNAPPSSQKEDRMSSKNVAAKPKKATAATEAGTTPARHLNDTTISPVCQAKTGENVEIPSWEQVKAQLEESLRASIEQAHAELDEAAKNIAQAQAERQQNLAEAKAEVEKLDGRLKELGSELSQALAIARQTLSGEALGQTVGEINLAHAAETEKVEGDLNAAEMAVAGLEVADEATHGDEDLELQLLKEQLRELGELGPEVANAVRLKFSAGQNARKALQLAREGEIQQASTALDLAVGAGAVGEVVEKAKKAIAEAARRGEIRAMIARIQAVDPTSRKPVDELTELAREAEQQEITDNVVSFLNHHLNLARQSERKRKREEAHLWALTRKEAQRWAENGIPEAGAILKYGPGVIRVFEETKKGWVLDGVHLFQDGVWKTRGRPARVPVPEVKGRNLVRVN